MVSQFDQEYVRQEFDLSQSAKDIPGFGKIVFMLPLVMASSNPLSDLEHQLINMDPASGYTNASDSTNTTFNQAVSASDLSMLKAMGELHEKLIESQIDLEPDIKDTLYDNLWDLYI